MSTYNDHGAVYTNNGDKMTTKSWTSSDLKKKNKSINTMRLFGLPYQFIETVDPRIAEVNPVIGSRYLRNVTLDAPIAYIIPGKPVFLPNKAKNKKFLWLYICILAVLAIATIGVCIAMI